MSSVSIASDNSTSTYAKVDDTITLTFTAAETIGTPTVTFQSGGAAINDGTVSYANPSGNTWTAKYDANTGDTEGSVTFSFAFSDSTGNAGVAVTAVTDGTSVTFDKTAPTISTSSIASDNSTTTVATTGDVVTLTIATNENVTSPTVSFTSGGDAATNNDTVAGDSPGNSFTSTYTVHASDTDGSVAISILSRILISEPTRPSRISYAVF